MSLQSDHKALIFVGAIAVLGAGVRITRASVTSAAVKAQPALDRQMQAADSAKRAIGAKRKPAKSSGAHAQQPAGGAVAAAVGRAGRVDADIATAAQLDSLPNVGPSLAKRIVLERMAHGPFKDMAGLRRRAHLSAKVAAQLDSLVTFSGAMPPSDPRDTIIAKPARSTRTKPPS